MKLATLNKLTSSNNMQTWSISVEKPSDIVIEFGQKDGKLQKSVERINAGKNIGKSNETTPWEQACLEATSRWNKKKDKGYFEEGELKGCEMLSTTCTLPMLAQSYDKHSKKIVFPAYVQPKLDGIRCVAIRQDGKVTLLSRTGKEFTAIPHINTQLDKIFPSNDAEWCLDGELYVHHENFQDIVSKIKRDEIHPSSKAVEYHIYDTFITCFNVMTYEDRYKFLKSLSLKDNIKLVETVEVTKPTELYSYYDAKIAEGYEGCMIRNKLGLYIQDKRSYDLQKLKEFQTEEFEVVGAEENRGKQAGQCTIICKSKSGKEFGVKPEGSDELRKGYWQLHQAGKLVGQQLTVRFFEYTKDSDIPRFPVGVTLRNYE